MEIILVFALLLVGFTVGNFFCFYFFVEPAFKGWKEAQRGWLEALDALDQLRKEKDR